MVLVTAGDKVIMHSLVTAKPKGVRGQFSKQWGQDTFWKGFVEEASFKLNPENYLSHRLDGEGILGRKQLERRQSSVWHGHGE